jgi:GNAT superfamily N-acetyltransferase
MPLTIRPATHADAGIIASFNQALAWESERKRLDEGVLLAGVRAVLDDPHKGFYTLAERDGEVVGQVLITTEWSDWRNGWFWWVQSVYVRADRRRAGVFAGLFGHLKLKATADPTVIGIRLYYDCGNTTAADTYRRMGMADTGYGMFEMYPLPGRGKHVE